MVGPLSLSFEDLSLFTAIMAIILLVMSELLSPCYSRTGIVIDRKRLRMVAVIVSIIFLSTAAYRILEIVTRI